MSSSKAVFTFGMTIFCLIALSPCTMSARVPDYINRKYNFIQLQLAFPKPLCNRFGTIFIAMHSKLKMMCCIIYHLSVGMNGHLHLRETKETI